eukprot:3038754-Amphidinium_carterae.1
MEDLSMFMPDGGPSWLRIEDGFVQHNHPFWSEIPHNLPLGEDLSPDWEEEEVIPRQPVPRQPKYKLRSRDVFAKEWDNRDANHTHGNRERILNALCGTSRREHGVDECPSSEEDFCKENMGNLEWIMNAL